MLFVSFATPDYHLEAASLVQSLEVLGLRYHVAMVHSAGDWVSNCGRKAAHMRSLWQEGQSMCWVDADARVLQQPEFLFGLDQTSFDVAWHVFEGQALSGTVWVSGSRYGRDFLDRWVDECMANRSAWDQRLMEPAKDMAGSSVCELPPEYCFIFDSSRKHWPDARPVIEHYQASRRLRRD